MTRDGDFEHFAATLGAPPKVIVLRSRDGRTAVIEAVFRKHASAIRWFLQAGEMNLLILE